MNAQTWIEAYKNELQQYSLAQLRHKAAPAIWSLGQMYNHLVLASLDYLDQVERCAASREEQHLGKTEAGEQMYRIGSFPPVKIKLPEGPANTPSNSDRQEDLIRGLDQVLERMNQWEENVNTINPNYKVKHDGFGWLNAREWYDMVGMHFKHHLRQQRELEAHYNLA